MGREQEEQVLLHTGTLLPDVLYGAPQGRLGSQGDGGESLGVGCRGSRVSGYRAR
jgi:hypothetical protein